MKKSILTLMLAVVTLNAVAAEYHHSVGAVVGGFNGVSYKGFVFSNPNVALHVDLGVGVQVTRGGASFRMGNEYEYAPIQGGFAIWNLSLNPNIEYQKAIGKGFSWFAGGGISGGMVSDIYTYGGSRSYMGQFGINAIAGVEYKVSASPMVIGIDFRPGYGLAATTAHEVGIHMAACAHYFDWHLALSLRYYL